MAATINGDGIVTVDGSASTQGRIRLAEQTGNGTNVVTIQAPASLASDLTFTLPSTTGTTGQFMQTDGSGNLSFATVTNPGTATFTSSGSITAGQPVYINSDGTVSTAALQTYSLTNGDVSATAQTSTSYHNTVIVYDELNDKYICFWFSATTTIAYAFGTLNTSTGAVTWANQNTVAAGATLNGTSPVVKVYMNNGVGALVFNSTSGYANVKFFSSTGTALTFGSTVTPYTNVAAYSQTVLDYTLKYDTFCNSWIFGVCGLNSGGTNTYCNAQKVTLSGLEPTFSNSVSKTNAYPNTTSSYRVSVYHDPASGIIVFRPGQATASSQQYIYAAVFNASAVPSIGSGYGDFESYATMPNSNMIGPTIKDPVSGATSIFMSAGWAYYTVTTSGITIPFQFPSSGTAPAPPKFYAGTGFWSQEYGVFPYNKFTNTFAIFSTVNTNYSHCIAGEFRNGGSLSFSAPSLTFLSGYYLNSQDLISVSEQAGHPSGWMVVGARRTGDIPTYISVRAVAQAKIRYVGIAASTVSTGQSVTVTVSGGVNTNQSGLSVGEPYYLNGTTITTTPGADNLIGYATSATSLLLV